MGLDHGYDLSRLKRAFGYLTNRIITLNDYFYKLQFAYQECDEQFDYHNGYDVWEKIQHMSSKGLTIVNYMALKRLSDRMSDCRIGYCKLSLQKVGIGKYRGRVKPFLYQTAKELTDKLVKKYDN